MKLITSVCGIVFLATSIALSAQQTTAKSLPKANVDVLHTDIPYPKALLVLTPDTLLVTDRRGKLHRFDNHQLTQWLLVADDVLSDGQGGVLDIEKSPDYAEDGWLYITYSAETDEGNALRLIRARLAEDALVDKEILHTVSPAISNPVHFGGKITFLNDGSLLITTGEGFDYREQAQNRQSQLGKVLRLTLEGQIPDDNPFVDDPTTDPAIFSLGHRNPQGLIKHSSSGVIYAHEHGPAGGDELNVLEAGQNYGWPVITRGKDYSGAQITPYRVYPGMQQPLVDWTPSIAPSSMIEYRGDMFPELQGDLLITTLKSKELVWLQLREQRIVREASLFRYLSERLRDVAVGHDGSLLLLTDGENGKILQITRDPGAQTQPEPTPKEQKKKLPGPEF